ncbi:MAG: putative DNA binding domain-containing protein [Atopobiaceae bacterium]|nr:putative DNA binding domain-containing protein [Atopobiaceae bacterium]
MNLGPETEILEYKRTTAEQKAAADSLCAMLNKHGHGVLIFGVKDDGTVMGQELSPKTIREVSQTIRDRISPAVYPQVERMAYFEQECVRVEVTGSDAPYSSAGVYYTRMGDEDVRMTREQLEGMLHKRHRKDHPWDAEASERTVDDVDEAELKAFVRKGQEAGRITFDYDGVHAVLSRLDLLDGEYLLNAAAVAFCRSRLPMVQVAVFAGETRQIFLDNQRFEGTLFELARQTEYYIANHLMRRFEFVDGQMHRNEIPEIPFKATREIIYNALCHRDYEQAENVQVDIFANRVEVFSPGMLPEDMDVKAHITGDLPYSRSRNKLLANVLYRSGDVETYGSGLPRVQRLCDEAGIGFELEQNARGVVAYFERPDWQREFAQGEDKREDKPDNKLNNKPDNNNDPTKENAGKASNGDLLSGSHQTINPTIKPTPGEQRVLDYLKGNPEASQDEISESLQISRSRVADYTSQLQAKSYLRRVGSRKKGSWVVLNPEELGL